MRLNKVLRVSVDTFHSQALITKQHKRSNILDFEAPEIELKEIQREGDGEKATVIKEKKREIYRDRRHNPHSVFKQSISNH